MSFRIGQKVVCIVERSRWVVPRGYIIPEKDVVYTVRSVMPACAIGPECIRLFEIVNPSTTIEGEPGYYARAFRPLDERETDISQFTAMLTPNKQKVDA